MNKIFNKKNFLLKKKKKLHKNFKIKFLFISLIPPFLINNLRFNYNYNLKNKKILLKQSYIMLTWFYYISFTEQNINNINNKIKIFVLPFKSEKFTLTKAPIAHKNWSKEQYQFGFYKFLINFKCFFKKENKINSLNKTVLFLILTKQNFPFFETNILFLKNIKIFLNFKDKYFFNYYKFINK